MDDPVAEAPRPAESSARAISATEPDWSRERRVPGRWEPSKALLKSVRDYQRAKQRGARLASKVAVLRHRFWSVVTGADVPLNCKIGGGLLIPHPNGIVIHPDAEIGPNCLLFQQVTIGDVHGKVPKLGGHVDVGAGAKLIGGVTIGNHATIGANSVVTSDVPAGATAVGVPARIVRTAG
jgi:serine O-acetyltransferase